MSALTIQNLAPAKLKTLYGLLNLPELRKELARRDLLSFVCYTMPGYDVNWHHRHTCAMLDRWIDGGVKRLMLFVPPRHGKSELGSRRLPAYILGKNPNASVIVTSYSADLASRMNRDVQRIIDSDKYAELFPQTQLYGKNIRTVAKGSWLRNSEIFEVVGHMGVYRSAGVGGGITGMGGQYIIIDDPIKNQEEADSETYRQRLWEWYTSTLYTRLEKDGRVLLILTRWHEDDLAGRLLALAESDPHADQWTVVKFPAVKETTENADDPREIGEALWPEKYNLSTLNTIRASVGSRVWASLYQQEPAPTEGGIFKRHWWRFWIPKGAYYPPVQSKMPDGTLYEHAQIELPATFEEQIQSWDMTFKDSKSSDFVAGGVWGLVGANKFLLDLKRERLDIIGSLNAIRQMSAKWPDTYAKIIEDKANGPAVIGLLQNEITGLIAYDPKTGKEGRANAVAPQVESGNVYLPHPAVAPWVSDFIDECAAFPNGAHDDRVDQMTQALLRWQTDSGSLLLFGG